SAQPPVVRGHGARLFVFARGWTREGAWRDGAWNPAEGLSLHDAAGETVESLEKISTVGGGGDPWAGCHIEVDAGFYRLRQTRGDGFVEQALYLPAGWQMQVFLLAQESRATDARPRVDLARASLCLARGAFREDDGNWRLTEMARQTLANRRAVAVP